ncbi:MAG: glutaredoxin domain-containing protein [Myxococcota bacterium]
MVTTVLWVVLAAAPLDEAKAHLEAGRLDDVLFALDQKTFTGEEKPKAAALLGDAAKKAYAKKDDMLALQFASMALKLEPAQKDALEAAARASFRQQQFEPAEKYADAWLALDVTNGQARLLRARLADEAGDWQVVVDQLDQAKLTGADASQAKALKAKAVKELAEKRASRSAVASLERQLAKAAEQRTGGFNAPIPASSDVVLYATSWCGYCRKAREYFNKKGVKYVERDIEKDEGAAQELAAKASAAGVRPQGVPVIDVRGKLILGFDRAALDDAL